MFACGLVEFLRLRRTELWESFPIYAQHQPVRETLAIDKKKKRITYSLASQAYPTRARDRAPEVDPYLFRCLTMLPNHIHAGEGQQHNASRLGSIR